MHFMWHFSPRRATKVKFFTPSYFDQFKGDFNKIKHVDLNFPFCLKKLFHFDFQGRLEGLMESRGIGGGASLWLGAQEEKGAYTRWRTHSGCSGCGTNAPGQSVCQSVHVVKESLYACVPISILILCGSDPHGVCKLTSLMSCLCVAKLAYEILFSL